MDVVGDLPLAGVGLGEAAVMAGLLEGDDIPRLVQKAVGEGGLGGGAPGAVGVLVVDVNMGIACDIIGIFISK